MQVVSCVSDFVPLHCVVNWKSLSCGTSFAFESHRSDDEIGVRVVDCCLHVLVAQTSGCHQQI